MAQLEYGLRKGWIVHASQVLQGSACGCTCLECGEKLTARNSIYSEYMPHFVHPRGKNCGVYSNAAVRIGLKKGAKLKVTRHQVTPDIVFKQYVEGVKQVTEPVSKGTKSVLQDTEQVGVIVEWVMRRGLWLTVANARDWDDFYFVKNGVVTQSETLFNAGKLKDNVDMLRNAVETYAIWRDGCIVPQAFLQMARDFGAMISDGVWRIICARYLERFIGVELSWGGIPIHSDTLADLRGCSAPYLMFELGKSGLGVQVGLHSQVVQAPLFTGAGGR